MKASRKVLLTIAASASPVYYGPAQVVYAPAPLCYYGPQLVYAQLRWHTIHRR